MRVVGRLARRGVSWSRRNVARVLASRRPLRGTAAKEAPQVVVPKGNGSAATADEAQISRAEQYWRKRKDLVYLHVVRTLMDGLAISASSAIDIGSNGCPYITWLPDHVSKASLDLRRPYVGDGVESIKANFLKWDPPHRYDLVMCLQVLEHVPDVVPFCKKLLDISNVLVVSVPYKWPKNHSLNHIHDPVDEKKMRQWFGFEPNFSYVATEVISKTSRLIQVFDLQVPQRWNSLKHRAELLQ